MTVVTDGTWKSGTMVQVFEGIQGVDRIASVSRKIWTTEGNRRIDGKAPLRFTLTPSAIKQAEIVYDCNSAFMKYERECGGKPTLGIAEFWLNHFGYEGNPHPRFHIKPTSLVSVQSWMALNNVTRPMIGIVLRAGDVARDWNFDDAASIVAAWIDSQGFQAVSIDPSMRLEHPAALNFTGQSIHEVAALLQMCRLVVTPDTGLLHLAEAVGTPTVALWGTMPPELRVKGYNSIVVPERSLGFCSSSEDCQCTFKFQQWSCLRRIEPEMIFDGIQRALEKTV